MLGSRYLLILLLIAEVAALVTPSVSAPQEGRSGPAYPIIFRYESNFTIVDLLVLNSTTLALAVNYNDRSAVMIVDVRDPIRGPEIIQTYPLSGRITAFSVDGFPPARLAVGSDRGEVYLFKIDGGRLHKLLHLIQGADFRVLSLFVARTAAGYKLIATVSEGQPFGMCTSCHVYVFDEDTLGALVISPHVSTTVHTCKKYVTSRVYPQVAIPAKVYTPGGYYYRADSVLLFWSPYVDVVMLDLGVYHSINLTAIEPAGSALVEISLLSLLGKVKKVYGWNADGSGRALIPLPRGYLANVSVVGLTRKHLVIMNLNTSAVAKAIRLNVTIPERVSTGPAEDVYGPPFFAKYFADILDLTGAPAGCNVIKTLDKEFYPTVNIPHFVDHGKGYLIALINGTYLELYNLNYAYNIEPPHGSGREYLGVARVSIVDVIGFSRDDIIIGFSDGRVKHYRLDALRGVYTFAQSIVTLGSLVRVQPSPGFSYFTFSTKGIQVVTLTPFQLPLLRVGFEAEFTIADLASAYSLPDMSLVALAAAGRGHSSLYIVMNLNSLLPRRAPINLASYMAPSLVVSIRPPAPHEDVNGSVVTLRYKLDGVGKAISKILRQANVTFTNLIPGAEYEVTITPPKAYILNYSATVSVLHCGEEGCPGTQLLVAPLGYRDFSVKLLLEDEYGGPPLGRLLVFVNNNAYDYVAPRGLELRLIYGNHTVCANSLDGYYRGFCTRVEVKEGTVLRIPLRRSEYNVTLIFTDKLTRRLVEPKLTVIINDLVYPLPQEARLVTTVKAGWINVTVIPLQELGVVYRGWIGSFLVNRSAVLEISLERATYDLEVVAMDELTGSRIHVVASVRVNGTEAYKGRLPVTLRLPYAYYSVELVPAEDYGKVFIPASTELLLDSSKSIYVTLSRRTYVLEISFRDRHSEGPIVPLMVLLNGSLYTVTRSRTLNLPLRAASYVILVRPIDEHLAAYEPIEVFAELYSNTRIALELTRRNFTAQLRFYDTSARGYLEGRFRVSFNTTVVFIVDSRAAPHGVSVPVPYGSYILTVTPLDAAERLYSTPAPATVNVFSNISHTVRLSRKLYELAVTVTNDLDERIRYAYVEALDPTTGVVMASIYTDDAGEARAVLPAGAVLVKVTKDGYHEYSQSLYLDRDSAMVAQLRPTIVTVIGRFSHVIALAIVATAVILIVLKLKAKLAERLSKAEEIF